MRKLLAALVVLVAVGYFIVSSEQGDGSILERWRTGGSFLGKEQPPGERLAPIPRSDEPPPAAEDEGFPPPEALEPQPADLAAEGTVRGRVVDLDGRGLAHLAVSLVHPALAPTTARSGPDGSFSLWPRERRGELVLDAPGLIFLGGRASVRPEGDSTHLLVAAPAIRVAGTVRDEQGAPLSGARAYAYVPLAAAAPDGGALLSGRWEVEAWSDELGVFMLEALPASRYTRLEVELEGFARHVAEAPQAATSSLDVVLRR